MKSLILIGSFLATSMAMACPLNDICLDSLVIDKSDRIGVVSEVFEKDKVRVKFDNKMEILNTSDLGVSTFGYGLNHNQQQLIVGNTVIDSEDVISLVEVIFSNGKTILKPLFSTASKKIIRDAKDLTVSTLRLGDLKIEDLVLDSMTNEMARINRLFTNDKAEIQFSNGLREIRMVSGLFSWVPCKGSVCVNDDVLTSNKDQNTGKLIALFSDGTALVKLPVFSYFNGNKFEIHYFKSADLLKKLK